MKRLIANGVVGPGLCAVLICGSVGGEAEAQTSGAAAKTAPTMTLHLNADASRIDWTVGAIFRKVHGTFKLKGGEVIVQPGSGVAQGEIEVDAASETSGDKKRDGQWQSVLDSEHYPAIIFHPSQIDGLREQDGEQTVHAKGTITLKGTDHPVDLTVKVTLSGESAEAVTECTVPYVKWGLRDPSAGLTRYDRDAHLRVDMKGKLVEQTAVGSPKSASKDSN